MPDHKKKGKKSGAAKNDSGSVISTYLTINPFYLLKMKCYT